MQLQFEAPLHSRVHRYGRSIGIWEMPDQPSLWWHPDRREWVRWEDRGEYEYMSSHCPRVRTLKAFKRHLRRHAESLKGYRVIWVNAYEGHNVEVQL